MGRLTQLTYLVVDVNRDTLKELRIALPRTNRRVDGKPTCITLGRFPGMTVEQARRKALSLLDGIENGTHGKPTTLGELWVWDVYCDVKRKKKSLDRGIH